MKQNLIPSPITVEDVVVTPLLVLTFLYIMGECLEEILQSSFIDCLKRKMDFLEHFCLDLALGVAYLSALISILGLLRLFNVVSVGLIVVIHLFFWARRRRTRERIAQLYNKIRRAAFGISINMPLTNLLTAPSMVLLIFAAFSLRFVSILGVYAQCQDDPKLHALLTQLIIENKGYFLTYMPYSSQFNDQPSLGFHGITAFFVLLFPLPTTEMLLILTMTFNALLVLFTYFLANRMFNNRWIAFFSALILGFLTDKPSGFWWGANNFIVGLVMAITVICIYCMDEGKLDHTMIKKAVIYGLLIGGSINFHVVLLFFCLTGILAWCISSKRVKYLYSELPIRLKTSLLVGIISGAVAFFSLFTYSLNVLYKFFQISFFPMGFEESMRDVDMETILSWSNDLPKDVIFNPIANASHLNRTISSLWYGESVKFLLVFGLPLAFCYIILSRFIDRETPFRKRGAFCSIVWFTMLFLLYQINPLGLIPFRPLFSILIGKFIHSSTWPLALFSAWILFCVVDSFFVVFTNFFLNIRVLNKIKRVFKVDKKLFFLTYPSLLIILILCFLFLFQWYNIAIEEATFRTQRLSEVMSVDSPLTTNDYRLMLWIRDNTSLDIILLVNPADAGQYIPIIAKRVCVLPYTTNSEQSKSYLTVIEALTKDPDNSTALRIMEEYQITHLFIGSKNILGREGFNQSLFVQSKHYSLIKQVGDSVLLEVVY